MTHVLTLKKFISRYETAMFVKCTIFFYKMVIYSDSVSYIFPTRPWIFSFRKYMLEVWRDISVRTRQLRSLNTDSTGRV